MQLRYNATYPGGRYEAMPGTAELCGEMKIDEDAGALTATYNVSYIPTREAGEPSGTLEATRVGLEPATP